MKKKIVNYLLMAAIFAILIAGLINLSIVWYSIWYGNKNDSDKHYEKYIDIATADIQKMYKLFYSKNLSGDMKKEVFLYSIGIDRICKKYLTSGEYYLLKSLGEQAANEGLDREDAITLVSLHGKVLYYASPDEQEILIGGIHLVRKPLKSPNYGEKGEKR
jgi:hypothetical protein